MKAYRHVRPIWRPKSSMNPQSQRGVNERKMNNVLMICVSAIVALLLGIYLTKPERTPPNPSRPQCVRWMAPFLSGGGYSSEAWSFVNALQNTSMNLKLKIDHHGDLQNPQFWHGLSPHSQSLAFKLHATPCATSRAIVVCHSEPGAWHPPLFETFPCPPAGYGKDKSLFVIGRTMFETDRLNAEHVKRCNRMDEVWVPTEFHVSTFIRSGVEPSKVVKMVQPVDVHFFDPSKHEALLLTGKAPALGASGEKKFKFLSVFKWEKRKGWDVLLGAYLREFSGADEVALYLLVNAYHSNDGFETKIVDFVEECGIEEPESGWAAVFVIDVHVPEIHMPRVYKAADAFVLPSRGEGWGRPVVEAMAMGLPVIVTNWSGPTEYLTEENGYLVAVERMSEVEEGAFVGHRWAEPARDELRVLMRRAVENGEEARRKGRRAREDMVERFSPEVVAKLVVRRMEEIAEMIVSMNL